MTFPSHPFTFDDEPIQITNGFPQPFWTVVQRHPDAGPWYRGHFANKGLAVVALNRLRQDPSTPSWLAKDILEARANA